MLRFTPYLVAVALIFGDSWLSRSSIALLIGSMVVELSAIKVGMRFLEKRASRGSVHVVGRTSNATSSLKRYVQYRG